MSIPVYDPSIYPTIQHPFENEKESTKKYLGNRAITGETYAILDIFIINNTEAKTLYDFWKDDCNYGTTPFLAPLPLFGEDYELPNILLKFIDNINMKKIDTHWNSSVKTKVIGSMVYVVEDTGKHLVTNSGIFLYTDITSYQSKEITWQ